MMKKICVITLFGDYNYGNRLQNYAVQQILGGRGYDVYTLEWYSTSLKSTLRRGVRRAVNTLTEKENVSRRRKHFRQFNKSDIQVYRLGTKDGLIPASLDPRFDFFVVGSDQVWNPTIRQNQRDDFFLRFTSREKRICLSPSIGVSDFEEQYRVCFRKGLAGFPFLSCREEDGAKAIEALTGRSCAHLPDPTLVLGAELWRAFAEKTAVPERYVVSFFLGTADETRRKQIRDYARENRAELIDLSDVRSKYYALGPKQFVYLLDHALTVFTDSFHVTAFSINLKTDFYVFDRHARPGDEDRMNSRVRSLVKSCALESRYLGSSTGPFPFRSCDFSDSEAALAAGRMRFDAYLDQCLSQKENAPYTMLPERDCTGCGCCAALCPNECLAVTRDSEGFLRPTVSDAGKCIACGRCVKGCPVLSSPEKSRQAGRALAAWNAEPDKIEKSSSGAIFPALAEHVLSLGGVVYGAAFQNGVLTHVRVDRVEELPPLYGAKYIQSESAGVYCRVRQDLSRGVPVLFSGTPCQVAALYAFLGQDDPHLITVDFVCHGCPSNLVWDRYLEHIRETMLQGEEVKSVQFRYKEEDWERYSLRISGSAHSFMQSRTANPYMRAFIHNLDLRESCHHCRFKGVERMSDFTLGDFWGIQQIAPALMNRRGTSLVIAHTEKAERLWEELDGCVSHPIAFSEFVGKSNRAMLESVVPHRNRERFLREISDSDTDVEESIERLCVLPKSCLPARLARRICRRFKRCRNI